MTDLITGSPNTFSQVSPTALRSSTGQSGWSTGARLGRPGARRGGRGQRARPSADRRGGHVHVSVLHRHGLRRPHRP